MKKNETQLEVHKEIDGILGGPVVVPGGDDPRYIESKTIKTPETETVHVVTPYSSREVALSRMGTTEKALVEALTDPSTSQEGKDARIAAYLFERGKESASFLAELFVFKGQYTKEGRQFRSELRFDFSAFVNMFQIFLHDTAKGLRDGVDAMLPPDEIFNDLADRFDSEADKLGETIEKIAKQRMKEKGFGIYLGKDGQPYREDDEPKQ